jgi:hypothetical protein
VSAPATQQASDSGGIHPRGPGCPQFSERLEDLERFKVAWEDCVKKHYDGESERVLVELLLNQVLGPELKERSRVLDSDLGLLGRPPQRAAVTCRWPSVTNPSRQSALRARSRCSYITGRCPTSRHARRKGDGGRLPHLRPIGDVTELATQGGSQPLVNESAERGPRRIACDISQVYERENH